MPDRKKEFRETIAAQLAALQARIEELATLAGHPSEHAISYETVVSEARRKHEETMRRLHELDARHDADWHGVQDAVRSAVGELRRKLDAVETPRR